MNPPEGLSPAEQEIWTDLALTCGQPRTPRELTGRIWCVKQLHAAGATGKQIRQAFRRWRDIYPRAACTPHALVKHWGELLDTRTDMQRLTAPTVTDREIKEATRQQTIQEYTDKDRASWEAFQARRAARKLPQRDDADDAYATE